jgi:hypothetical protein
MRRKTPTILLAAMLSAMTAAGFLAPAAQARDLVRAAAMVALADDPPPTHSEKLAQQQREAEAQAKADEKTRETVEKPYYKKWWFWALTAAVIGGTVALGVWAVEPTTVPARACSPGVIGCFGDGRSGVR